MSTERFYSNGKLLLTGEYLVLDGAEALAIPTQFGQDLVVKENNTNRIEWTSYDDDGDVWYSDSFTVDEVLSNSTHENPVTQTLLGILRQGHTQNPEVLADGFGFEVSSHLTFPRKWGLGTSSTLINNVAQWFEIDAFELLQKSFGGSGYDIACAQTDAPIFYVLRAQRALFNAVDFNPDFKQNLFFVYLNQKQNSREAIQSYRERTISIADIQQVTSYTRKLYEALTIDEFQEILYQHEAFLSEILNVQPIKEQLFADFEGAVKSLGAWGGDFVLVASSDKNAPLYFRSKGYDTILSYDEMILS